MVYKLNHNILYNVWLPISEILSVNLIVNFGNNQNRNTLIVIYEPNYNILYNVVYYIM